MNLTLEGIVALAGEHLAGRNGVFIAPHIPARKEKNARAIHAATLPPDEPIAALYDDTLFGAGDDGWLITPERICWRNFTEEPVMLPWSEITTIDFAEPILNGKRIKGVAGDTLAASMALFRALAGSATTSGSAALRALASEPCRLCGGDEHLYFSAIRAGEVTLPFEALVCRACRYTHMFNIEAPLENRQPPQVLRATPKPPYR
jgi:hypothetical protein